MLYYNRIDVSRGIDPTESNTSKEYMICHYWFFNHGFNFQDSVWNDCHDLTILQINISGIAITSAKDVVYCCIMYNINKSEDLKQLIRKFCI